MTKVYRFQKEVDEYITLVWTPRADLRLCKAQFHFGGDTQHWQGPVPVPVLVIELHPGSDHQLQQEESFQRCIHPLYQV